MFKRAKINKRHESEREFHDRLAEKTTLKQINIKGLFEAETAPETRYAYSQMNGVSGKRILDLGCGTGEASLYFAAKGAIVNSVDISPKMIGLLKLMAKKKKYSKRIKADVMLAEKLKFPKNYFDIVYGRGVLHHVDAGKALEEVYRVLKPGGVGTFVEPLEHNPAINIYRKIAKDVRTSDEIPLNYDKINKITKARFKSLKHDEFHLATLLIMLWYFLVDRVNPNKERYWDKLINDSKNKEKVFMVLNKIDRFIFFVTPFLRRYAWYTVLIFKK